MDINNRLDVIDSRDIEKLRETLEDNLEALRNDNEDIVPLDDGTVPEDLREDYEEWKIIASLSNEGAMNAADWESGTTLIRHSYFVQYCREMLVDDGTVPEDLPWYIEIDWAATAINMEQDYSTVDYDGVEYLVRS